MTKKLLRFEIDQNFSLWLAKVVIRGLIGTLTKQNGVLSISLLQNI